MVDFKIKFKELLKNEFIASTNEEIDNTLEKAIKESEDFDYKTGDINLIILMEELSELQQSISKYIRKRNNKLDILEEMADVFIYLRVLYQLVDISEEEFNAALRIKMDRFIQRTSNNNSIHSENYNDSK